MCELVLSGIFAAASMAKNNGFDEGAKMLDNAAKTIILAMAKPASEARQ